MYRQPRPLAKLAPSTLWWRIMFAWLGGTFNRLARHDLKIKRKKESRIIYNILFKDNQNHRRIKTIEEFPLGP